MAKKKATKKAVKRTSKKSHGELFEKHPNLLWLLPVFLIISALAVMYIWKDQNPDKMDKYIDEKVMIDEDSLEDTLEETEDLVLE